MVEAASISNITLDDREDPPHLKCIFYAEFDSRVGPKIVYQIPDDKPDQMISKETFDSLSGFFITKPELLDKFIKVNTTKLKMMGYPVVIENKKYERNAFIFNLCFVVDNISHLDCLYEPIVRKMAHYLINLEIECEYLSKEATKSDLKRLMRAIFDDLNTKKQCSVKVNDRTCIQLKLMPKVYPNLKNSPISPHDAPVLRKKFDPQWADLNNRLDVVSATVLPHLDGFSPISQISELTQLDKQVVCRCVENLQYHGMVSVLPVFLYTNFYALTSKVQKLYDCEEKFKVKFCTYVALPSSSLVPKFSDVFRLLCRIQLSLSIRDWCMRQNPRGYNIDERRLIQLSVYHGFLRKLTFYPATMNVHKSRVLNNATANASNFYVDRPANASVNNNEEDAATTATLAESSAASTSAATSFLDGTKSLEELAALWGQRPSETYQRLETNSDVVMLMK